MRWIWMPYLGLDRCWSLGIDYVHLFQKLRMELRSVRLRTRCLEVYLGSGGGQSLFEKRPTLAR